MATQAEAPAVLAASEEAKPGDDNGWHDVSPPDYLKQVSDLKFLNISIKGYEKKLSTGFPKEEYYAYRIVSMYVQCSVTAIERETGGTVLGKYLGDTE